ncbi:MAG TPA: class I tRNA ligase family protein, partial [Fimbriimonadaceae bacterium]|nr:class I tRNA ligase family protein [Fimbriimonadaceae bacterium]
ETDVLDVWFDSGSTHLAVLEGNVEEQWREELPASVYLEGSDQHRGWFNSSLCIGTAVRRHAPYQAVVTHGFVTDEKGFKMSKRLGNVVDPVEVCGSYGADILRYWVSSVDWENDVPCGDNILKQMGDGYRTVRNTLRFLLGNLDDYDGSKPEIFDLDEWVIEQCDLLVADCVQAYGQYEFGRVINGVHNFCAKELSKFYLDAIKDRMYCDGKDWPSRRSGQFACHYVLVRLVKLLAPILVHTAEETYRRIPHINRLQSVHMEVFDVPSEERLALIEGSELQTRFAAMLAHRAGVFAEFETWKGQSGVKDSQDVVITLSEQGATYELLRSFGDDLAILYKVSEVRLVEGAPSVTFEPSPYAKCERSRLRRPDVEVVNGVALSARDRRVLGL